MIDIEKFRLTDEMKEKMQTATGGHLPDCDGDGFGPCFDCGGNGASVETSDDGEDTITECEVCEGYGRLKCSACEGT